MMHPLPAVHHACSYDLKLLSTEPSSRIHVNPAQKSPTEAKRLLEQWKMLMTWMLRKSLIGGWPFGTRLRAAAYLWTWTRIRKRGYEPRFHTAINFSNHLQAHAIFNKYDIRDFLLLYGAKRWQQVQRYVPQCRSCVHSGATRITVYLVIIDKDKSPSYLTLVNLLNYIYKKFVKFV
jgi:hypothetical protein